MSSAASLSEQFFNDPMGFYELRFRELAANKDVTGSFHGLDTCVWATHVSEPYLERLSAVALYDKGVRRLLREAGFPDDVWLPTYKKIIVTQVELIGEYLRQGTDIPSTDRLPGIYELEQQMHRALADYNQSNGNPLQLPEAPDSFCGGDFIGEIQLECKI